MIVDFRGIIGVKIEWTEEFYTYKKESRETVTRLSRGIVRDGFTDEHGSLFLLVEKIAENEFDDQDRALVRVELTGYPLVKIIREELPGDGYRKEWAEGSEPRG